MFNLWHMLIGRHHVQVYSQLGQVPCSGSNWPSMRTLVTWKPHCIYSWWICFIHPDRVGTFTFDRDSPVPNLMCHEILSMNCILLTVMMSAAKVTFWYHSMMLIGIPMLLSSTASLLSHGLPLDQVGLKDVLGCQNIPVCHWTVWHEIFVCDPDVVLQTRLAYDVLYPSS